jgi:hypothetical protein
LATSPQKALIAKLMKPLTLTIIIVQFLTPALFAAEDSLLARVTVYWAKGGSGSDPDTRNHKTSTGKRLRSGHCAVDPRRIPYGSRVLLPNGEVLAAVDTGGAVKTRKAARNSGRTVTQRNALVVDRFFETKRQALAWARSHPAFMPVRIMRPGSQIVAEQLIPVQPDPRARVVSKQPAAKKLSTTTGDLLASDAVVSRNSLNRLGR